MFHLLAIIMFLAALVACGGYGSFLLRLLHAGEKPSPLRVPVALALGMGTLAYLILAAGLLGHLTPVVLGGLVLLGWVLAGVEARSAGEIQLPHLPRPRDLGQGTALAISGYLVLLAGMTLLSALRNPDGLDWDSLSYHLAAPKIYLQEGRISFIPYDSHTDFPFTLEMLYTLGLAFGGAGAAKLFHWAAGWLTVVSIGIWTSRLEVAGSRLPAWAGPLAAAVFGSMPVVLWEMGTAYVDLGTALFQFLALAVLIDTVASSDGGPEVRLGGVALGGVLSGFALGTKYTALLQFGLLGLGLVWVVVRARPEARAAALKAVVVFGALGIAVASPWYIKNWIWVHNPVYPFFYSLFPGSYSWTRQAELAYATEQRSFGLGRGPQEALNVFWNLGLHGRAFYINLRTLVGDKLGSLGPVWAGLLPLLFWTRGLGWRCVALLAYSFTSIAVWFLMSQQVRYLMPVFAPLAVVMAVVAATQTSRLLRGAAGLFLALCLVMNLVMHAPLALNSVQLLTGQVDEHQYLDASMVPGSYQVAGFVNQLPENSKIALYQETRGYYLDRNYFWANPLQHDLIPYERLQNWDGLAGELRKHGITHVLINYNFAKGVQAEQWYRLLMDGIRTGKLEEVFRSDGAELERKGVMVYAIR
ncbi:MAG: hypothetical protein K0Q72_428 [Armatimonadetes bacterium]|nr:hypothetical protein [Armatimonadota bacterium]